MEIRAWLNQQLVLPTDMNGVTSDMYQRSYDYSHFAPVILWGLQFQNVSGNTAVFSAGAARCNELTTANYAYLPTPTYGTGYPGIIEIPTSAASITLNTSLSPSFIVATYSISPTSSGQTLYTVTGNLSQVTSVTTSTQVVLAQATYSGTWSFDQTPGTNRNYDMSFLSALQYNLTNNQVLLNSPQNLSGTSVQSILPFVAQSTITANANIQTNTGYIFNPAKTDVATTATPINALTSATSMIRFTGSTATTVNGIAAPPLPIERTIYNQSSVAITFTHLSGSAATGNKISMATAANFTLNAGYCLPIIYDSTAGLWVPRLSTY